MISSLGFCSRQRTIVDDAVRVERQAVLVGDLDDAVVQPDAFLGGAETEGDVFGDGEAFEQGEMLEHHADAQALGLFRVLDGDFAAFPDDLAGVGLDHAIDGFDQGAFAGAVFPEQSVDLVSLDGERNVVICEAAWILFGHAGHRQERAGMGRCRLRHWEPPRLLAQPHDRYQISMQSARQRRNGAALRARHSQCAAAHGMRPACSMICCSVCLPIPGAAFRG
jgi:hypothetical protein